MGEEVARRKKKSKWEKGVPGGKKVQIGKGDVRSKRKIKMEEGGARPKRKIKMGEGGARRERKGTWRRDDP